MQDPSSKGTAKRIGLLGGSFDPVHRAHIELAKIALNHLALDEVQLLPAKQPWQKPTLSASASDRLIMLQLAVQSTPGLTINAIELDRPGKTYTLDTLKALPAENQYYWLLGADQLTNFPTWRGWQEIAQRVTLVVANRPGSELRIPAPLQAQITAGQARVQTLPFEALDVSSSQLRQALGRGESADAWLAPAVANYIKQHQLYQDRPTAAS